MQDDYVIGVFLDIKGAFDNISHEAQVRAMEDNNVPQIIVEWHKNYLENRFASCLIGHQKVTAHLKTGTAQGAIGSPEWYNYNQDPLLEDLSKKPVKETGFADDLAFLSHTHDQMQRKTSTLDNLSKSVGLKIHPGKSKILKTRPHQQECVKTEGKIWKKLIPFLSLEHY